MSVGTGSTAAVLLCALSGIAGPGPDVAFPGAEWQTATPESQGIDSERLRSAVDSLAEALRDWGGADTLFIARHGQVVWAGPRSDAEYQIFSATKSFTSTCLGLLIEDGKCSLDTRAAEHVAALAAQYPDVTLRHFATMTSGYDAAPVAYEADDEGKGDSWTPDPPADPLFAPGARFRYWDEAMVQFGNTLAAIAGQPLDELFRARIGDRIGMDHLRWDAGSWTGGIHTTSRELARFGLLFLRRGNWNGQQLVRAEWVDQATRVQVANTVPNDDLPRSRGAGVYGYNWWVNGVKPDGELLWPEAPAGTYYANGLHSNVCIVIPAWDIVIARTNAPRPDGSTSSPPNVDAVWNTFLGSLGRTLQRETAVSIEGDAFYINGRPTYEGRVWQGHKVEGLLLNSRMVQGIFDDLNPGTVGRWAYPDTGKWDPERNTREFVDAMPAWREHGLLGFTLNLQGGSPEGYSAEQPWHNSAIAEDGALRPEYMGRLESILDRADELGMVAILGVFYFGQDQRLVDEAAVLRALDNAVEWVLDHGYRNVLIEVNNECDCGYDHAVLQPERVHELIDRVKTRRRDGRRLLVGTSYGGGAIPGERVVRASDFLLIHGNGVGDPSRIAGMVRATREVPGYHPMPILVNEDDHFDFDAPLCNVTAAIGEYCSWGYFDPGDNNYRDGYQSVPTNWGINTERKRAFFRKVREISGP